MSSSRHRSHQSSSGSPRRGRILVFLIGIAAVLIVAIAVPLALSSPPITQGITATDIPQTGLGPTPNAHPGSTQGLPLPGFPSMVPVGESSPQPGPSQPGPSQPGPSQPGPSQPAPSQPGPSLNPSDGLGTVATQIRIPSLSIDLKIVEGDGIDVPLFKAAHFPGSSWPGGGSNIYLYGHARDGMFITLWDARVGDQVFLDLKDGTTRTYIVDKIDRVVLWNDLSVLDPTPTEQLTLQTCISYGETAPRFVVIAHPAT